jgi:hypothetical protein
MAQSLSLQYEGAVVLPGSAQDASGQTFTVRGLSGLAYRGDLGYHAVMDNSDRIVPIDIQLNADGSVAQVGYLTGLQMDQARDHEGIAHVPGLSALYLSEENGPGLHRHGLDGTWQESLIVPPVFGAARSNRGFESLSVACDQLSLWTANEEALSVDGALATPTSGSVVRLLRFDLTGPSPVAAEQYAYWVEPMHGPYIPGGSGQSGLVDMVALPDGRILAMERSLALAFPPFLTRIFEVEITGASDVSALGALAGATFTPVSKNLLWAGAATNLEGLALGPDLIQGGRSITGVTDDGDPITTNALVAFDLVGADGPCGCEASPYCVTTPNGAGAGARMGWLGTTSLSSNDLVLQVTGAIPGQFGLFFLGDKRTLLPVADGMRCVAGNLARLPALGLDSLGSAQFALDLSGLPGGTTLAPGTTLDFQFWYRAPLPGGAGSNFSDALEVRFCD